MSDNWYIVLDLEIEPPVHDEAMIATKIEEKRKFWAIHFNDFKNGNIVNIDADYLETNLL